VSVDVGRGERELSQRKIRCLLVHDHRLVRQGLRRLLEDESDLEIIEEARDASEALEKVTCHRPDVVLVDAGLLRLSSLETLDAVRLMRQVSPGTRIVFLSMQEDDDLVVQGLPAGSVAWVRKDASARELVEMVRAVYGGQRMFSEVGEKPVAEARRSDECSRDVSLTPREREVMKLLAEGMTVRRAADHLGLSRKTVDVHKFNLMRKLGIHNRVELVTWAIQKNIVKVASS